ncbi:DUF6301 family protein [Gulosibacter bifidus]|uniref:DUF6301 family protein n=1 Tax=Gulosibacter bifidus TaxID=272239 RepID=A0ABW5RHA6_9MICO|nr:DUF6301 family protein [Gulosibacter bifidus]
MSNINVVSVTELRPVLEALDEYEWPVPFDSADGLFQRLGWERQRKKGGRTNFAVSKPFVAIGDLHGELSRIEFRVSDTYPEATAEVKASMLTKVEELRGVVTEVVGFGPTGAPWTVPGYVWDFADGRQIQLKAIDRLIELQYWSKRYADIERAERRQHVDPDKNLEP